MLYDNWIEVEENDKKAKAGKSAIVTYSNYKYNNVCMVFKNKIRSATGEYHKDVCNKIKETTEKPSGYTPKQKDKQEDNQDNTQQGPTLIQI